MPNPDERPYAQKQSDHAIKSKAERALMDMTGASRSMIRERFGGQIAESMQRARQQPEPATEKRPAPEVKVTSQTFPSGALGALSNTDSVAAPPPVLVTLPFRAVKIDPITQLPTISTFDVSATEVIPP